MRTCHVPISVLAPDVIKTNYIQYLPLRTKRSAGIYNHLYYALVGILSFEYPHCFILSR